MKSELYLISKLKKNSKAKEKNFECEDTKASSTTNLNEKRGTKNSSVEKLVKLVKQLKIENKSLRQLNEVQENQIRALKGELSNLKEKIRTDESLSQPISCMRTSNSVPKKNRVFFSKELVQVQDESMKKIKWEGSGKPKEDPVFVYSLKKVSRKGKQNESHSPDKRVEQNEYYTPLSSSLEGKKGFSQTVVKDLDLKFTDKLRHYQKISRF